MSSVAVGVAEGELPAVVLVVLGHVVAEVWITADREVHPAAQLLLGGVFEGSGEASGDWAPFVSSQDPTGGVTVTRGHLLTSFCHRGRSS